MAARTASQRSAIPPFLAMEVMRSANARAEAGADILHLEVGQPSTPAPAAVREAAALALARDRLGYTEALGLPALRRRIARHYGETYDLDLDWRRIIVTTGSSAAFVLAFLAAFDAGERILVGLPAYPAYRHIPAAVGIEVVPVAVDATTRFQLQADHLAARTSAGPPINGLIVASPANPAGSMLSAAALADLVRMAEERDLVLISDEIYHGITYEEPAASALAFGDQPIVVNSFSKYFSMTGWRLGWLIVPEPLVRPIECLAQNLYISPPTLSQSAAVAAFDCSEELAANVARYRENRRRLLSALPRLGLRHFAPADGAFYLYADVSRVADDSAQLAGRMLHETGIAVTPGNDFDPVHGRGFLRLSYAGATAEIAEAIRRLEAWGGLGRP